MTVTQSAMLAKGNVYYVQFLTSQQKNDMLKIIADCLILNADEIISANKIDIKNCSLRPAHFIDRLMLNKARIKTISDGVFQLTTLVDPIGEIIDSFVNERGLRISKVRVPLGVACIIYEARPNVTVDAIALCLKSGNAVVLRGSSETICSNVKIVEIIKSALQNAGYNPNFISLVEDTTREGVQELFKLKEYIDVLIPRGGAGLIKSVVENSIIPVIETGTGNCHIYIEKTANIKMATQILFNAKTSRPSVCNTCESLLIDDSIAKEYLPILYNALQKKNVIFYGCEKTCEILPQAEKALDSDYYAEFLDYKLSVKVVSDIACAISHINKYSTKHSDCIVTEDVLKAEKFLNEVDSAAVYHNASTRFTDGFEFGFGAEMGISTQKLHARGPMGLKELTTYKYKISGNGNIR